MFVLPILFATDYQDRDKNSPNYHIKASTFIQLWRTNLTNSMDLIFTLYLEFWNSIFSKTRLHTGQKFVTNLKWTKNFEKVKIVKDCVNIVKLNSKFLRVTICAALSNREEKVLADKRYLSPPSG